MDFDALFVNPNGRTSRQQFLPALVTVLAALAFFAYIVPGRTSQFCILMLLYPAGVLLARRLRDLQQSAWPLLAPLALLIAMLAIRLHYFSFGDVLDGAVKWSALVISAAFVVWGCVKK